MRFSLLLSLPSTLLLLLVHIPTTAASTAASPPATSEVETRDRVAYQEQKDAAILRRLAVEAPIAVRKMSGEPGEKFYLNYWEFELEEESVSTSVNENLRTRLRGLANRPLEVHQDVDFVNASMSPTLLPPFLLHSGDDLGLDMGLRNWPRNILKKRDYQCPTGTEDCVGIGYPNSCCGQGETCVRVADGGSTVVGCCPSGSSNCGGSVSSCATAAGYTACPVSAGGGCCIPGYTCDSVGCAATGTTIVTASGTTTIAVAASTTPISTPSQVTTTTVVATATVTPTPSSHSVSISTSTVVVPTSTAIITPLISTATASSTTTITLSPAVLATTNSQPSAPASSPPPPTTTPSPSTSVPAPQTCAPGFYQCSARYAGCCPMGLNCDTSSCLAQSSTTVASGANGLSIVVLTIGSGVTTTTASSPLSANASTPVVITASGSSSPASGSTTTTATAYVGTVCATGWYLCGAGAGGGCCPSGYACGGSCVATQTGEPKATVYKGSPGTSNAGVCGARVQIYMVVLAVAAAGVLHFGRL